VVSKYGEVSIRKTDASIWFQIKKNLMEDETKYKVVTKNDGHALLRLGSMLVTVVSEAAKNFFTATSKEFRVLKVYFVLAGLILFFKDNFCCKVCL